MADPSHRPQYNHHHLTSGGHNSTKSWLYAAAAGVALGGPLVGMSGLSFIAALTLLVIASPLLLIFSPLLLGAGLLLVGMMAAFVVTAVMGVAGVSSLGWVFRSATRFIRGGDVNDGTNLNVTDVIGGVVDTAKGSEEVKEVLVGSEEGGKEEYEKGGDVNEDDSNVNIERDTDKETNKDRYVDDDRAAAAEKEVNEEGGGDNTNVNVDRSEEKDEDGKDKEGGANVDVDRSAEKDEDGKDKEGDANVDVARPAEKEADTEEGDEKGEEDKDGDRVAESKESSGKETKKKNKGREKTSSK